MEIFKTLMHNNVFNKCEQLKKSVYVDILKPMHSSSCIFPIIVVQKCEKNIL